jgi:cobalt-zinc-cadmium efflux system membrane fusion protein
MRPPVLATEGATRAFAIGIAIAAAAGLLGSGCSSGEQAHANSASQEPPPARVVQADATVELSASQLNAIKIEPVGTYPFSVEKEALGNIDFDEDLAVVQAESALIGAAATFELSNKALARVRDLYAANGGVPQKELEQAISDHETAEGALKAARDAVRVLGKTDAEIDRMIGSRKVEAVTLSTRWMVANVPESDTPFIRVGQAVDVRVAAHPERVFKGKVSKVYAVIDPSTHRSKVRCAIADPQNELRPGMLTNFAIRVQDPVEATAVPADAVVREGDDTMTAWVTTDRLRFQQKVITPALRQDGRVEILAGLKRGDLVVTEGAVFLSNLLQAPPTD